MPIHLTMGEAVAAQQQINAQNAQAQAKQKPKRRSRGWFMDFIASRFGEPEAIVSKIPDAPAITSRIPQAEAFKTNVVWGDIDGSGSRGSRGIQTGGFEFLADDTTGTATAAPVTQPAPAATTSMVQLPPPRRERRDGGVIKTALALVGGVTLVALGTSAAAGAIMARSAGARSNKGRRRKR